MKFKPMLIFFALNLVGLFTLPAYAVVMVWNKTPLNIQIPVSTQQESKQLLVSFPEKVQFGLPNNLKSILNVQNNYSNHTLYITAHQYFASQQVMVKAENGDLILINLSATKEASDEPISIEFANAKLKTTQKSSIESQNYPPMPHIGISQLVRYGVQQLYAPKRLLHSVRGISQTQTFNGKAYDVIQDGSATVMPLYSWSGGGLVVTALLIKNNLNIPVTITPEMVCGGRYAWKGFSPFPQSKLLPRGSRYDTTTLFLVSENSFNTEYDTYCKV